MTDLTHRDIYERITRIETILEERHYAREKKDLDTKALLEQISARLGKLEIAAVSDKASLSEADKWRGRMYVVLRYFLPPSLGATIMYWIMTHWGNGRG